MATKEELEAELKKVLAENARLRNPNSGPPKRSDPKRPVVLEDIKDPDVRQLVEEAQLVHEDYADTDENRQPLAEKAQDLVIALRELDVAYSGHSVGLLRNANPKTVHNPDGSTSITRGDLFVHGQPCHPRDVAARLAAGSDVGDLAELVEELTNKLKFEATP